MQESCNQQDYEYRNAVREVKGFAEKVREMNEIQVNNWLDEIGREIERRGLVKKVNKMVYDVCNDGGCCRLLGISDEDYAYLTKKCFDKISLFVYFIKERNPDAILPLTSGMVR